jgi:23S rRNA pseudouridine2457 synthase
LDYFIINKPFGYLSQFTREIPEHKVLGDLYDFPPDVYPVGRLDRDSEGLLILTNDKRLNSKLLNPKNAHQRTYWVQVEGEPTPEAIDALQKGVSIKINKKTHQSLPTEAIIIPAPAEVPERDPPVRFRKSIPTTWIQLKLTEGKNRQVRKMCAKVGFPVLRLLRVQIEDLKIPSFEIGTVRRMDEKHLFRLLKL